MIRILDEIVVIHPSFTGVNGELMATTAAILVNAFLERFTADEGATSELAVSFGIEVFSREPQGRQEGDTSQGQIKMGGR